MRLYRDEIFWILAIVVGIAGLIGGCWYVAKHTSYGPELSAVGEIRSKEYRARHYDLLKKRTEPAEFHVTWSWVAIDGKHLQEHQNNESLYNRVSVGDKITVYYRARYWKGEFWSWEYLRSVRQ